MSDEPAPLEQDRAEAHGHEPAAEPPVPESPGAAGPGAPDPSAAAIETGSEPPAPPVPLPEAPPEAQGVTSAPATPDAPASRPGGSAVAPSAQVKPTGPLARLAHRVVTVESPASTANLGAGYDALAMALDHTNRVTVEALPEPVVELTVEGEGARELPADRRNRFVVALETGLRWALGEVPAGIGWRVTMRNRIPLARGLGSSAAATVAGLVAADALTGGGLDAQRQLALACELEGHPDNASAALLGGFVVVTLVDGQPETVRFDVPRNLRVVLFVPELPLATGAMRAALPHDVPHRDAAFNVGRAALAVAALASGHYEHLRTATEDRLHEPYRAAVFPALPRLVAAARDAGALGACLSGAGSTVIAFGDSMAQLAEIERAFVAAAVELDVAGSVQMMAPRNTGAVVVEVR